MLNTVRAKNKSLLMFVLSQLLVLSACAPSQQVIQQAVVQTLTAMPTDTPIPSQTPVPSGGKWVIETDVSEFDDSQTVLLILEAEKQVEGWLDSTTPVLLLRCREGKREAFIHIGMSLHVESGKLDRSTIRFRFDKEKADTVVMSQSTDGDALFFGEPDEWIELMLQHKTMLFGFTPFNAPPVETTFNLVGLQDAIKPLYEACPLE